MALKHAKSGDVLHLSGVDDPAARTVALAKTRSFEAIHLVVRARETLPVHRVEGSMTLHCLEGRVRFDAGKAVDMRAGDWVYLDPGTPHALHGIDDSALLLTILFDAPVVDAGASSA
jgi:quercetin dioxygenase-like cupin family protein